MEVKRHEVREQIVHQLIAYVKDQGDPTRFFIDSEQDETQLLCVFPTTVTHVRQLWWKERLSSNELELLLEGDQLERLVLAHNDITWNHFHALSKHSRLEKLILSDCELEMHWKEFLHFNSIRSMAIGRIAFPANMTRELPTDLSQLDHFGMTGQIVDLPDIDFMLDPTASVSSLSLIDCDLSIEAVRAISKLTSLKSLDLRLSKFNGSALISLIALKKLTSLNLAQTLIEDDDIEFISEMGSLEFIYLWGCENITVRTRESIESSTELNQLKLVTFGSDDKERATIPVIDRRH